MVRRERIVHRDWRLQPGLVSTGARWEPKTCQCPPSGVTAFLGPLGISRRICRRPAQIVHLTLGKPLRMMETQGDEEDVGDVSIGPRQPIAGDENNTFVRPSCRRGVGPSVLVLGHRPALSSVRHVPVVPLPVDDRDVIACDTRAPATLWILRAQRPVPWGAGKHPRDRPFSFLLEEQRASPL